MWLAPCHPSLPWEGAQPLPYLGDRRWSQAEDCQVSWDSTCSRSLPLPGCSSTSSAVRLMGTSTTENVPLASLLYFNVPVMDNIGTKSFVLESTQNS